MRSERDLTYCARTGTINRSLRTEQAFAMRVHGTFGRAAIAALLMLATGGVGASFIVVETTATSTDSSSTASGRVPLIEVPDASPEACKLYYDVVIHLNNLTSTAQNVSATAAPAPALLYSTAVFESIDSMALLSKFGGCDATQFRLP